MRTTVFLSIALNLLLLTTIVVARVDSTRIVDADSGDTQPDPLLSMLSSDRSGRVTSARELIEALRETPLQERTIKTLTQAWLERELAQAAASNGIPYWQQGFSPALDELVNRTSLEQNVRTELVSIFGPGASADPAFSGSFRPLGAGYAFLGSEAQVALQRHQIERLRVSSLAEPVVRPSSSACVASLDAARDGVAARSPLPAAFSPAEEREFLLRYSPLAEQLRQSGAAESEAEFRALFALALRLDSESSTSARATLRDELRARMGNDAFDGFLAMRDPLFDELQTYLAGKGFARDVIAAAYSVMNRAQEQLLGKLARPGNPENLVPPLDSVRQTELAGLTQLLGESVAKGLLMVRNRAVSERLGKVGSTC
jgi:hypothetical protein